MGVERGFEPGYFWVKTRWDVLVYSQGFWGLTTCVHSVDNSMFTQVVDCSCGHRLEDIPSPLNFPFDRLRNEAQTF